MNRPCEKVGLFVDGELPVVEADAFRDHLPDCEDCQREMTSLMQLKLMSHSHVERVGVQHPVVEELGFFSRLRSWGIWSIAAVAVPALAMVALLLVNALSPPKLRTDVWLVKRPERLLEARVSYPGADIHRPPAARSMGGADAPEALPYKDMDTLEEHNRHGLAAVYLVRPKKDLAQLALVELDRELERLGRSPDLVSDRAVALMTMGNLQEALKLLDWVLEQNPRHPQALWNRALVLRDLGLTLQAAQAFSEVAALNEPGWAEEAKERAEKLRNATNGRREKWETNSETGKALVDVVPEASSEKFKQFIPFPSARRYFYEAVRAATTREQVLALQSLAKELDARAGGKVLESYVLRVAAADFSRRAPLSQAYRALLKKDPRDKDKAQAQEQLFAQLLASKEDDILLGVLSMADVTERSLEVLEAKAPASGDPWFQLLAVQLRTKKEGSWDSEAARNKDALRLCEEGKGLEYRCILLKLELSNLYLKNDQFDLSREQAKSGWEMALKADEWQAESSFLWNLAQLARINGDTSLNRAYLAEFNARRGLDPELEKDKVRRTHQERAVVAVEEFRIDDARKEIDAALATGRPLGLPGVFALADISRQRPAPEDKQHLERSLEELAKSLKPHEQVIATHVRGRFALEHDVEQGRQLLWQAIKKAEALKLEDNTVARRARAYSFTSLLFEAGKRSDFQQVMELLARERGTELPSRCLLVASMDSERLLFLARGADAGLVGHYDGKRDRPLSQPVHKEIPEQLLKVLEPCEQVDVLARAPLHGRVGLLPSNMAWSYLTRSSPPRAPRPGPAVHLVVADVKLPEKTELETLNDWKPGFGREEQQRLLSGKDATPSRVLAAMKDATEIDLVAHGTINDFSDAAYLMLAEEQGGGSKLGVFAVRKASLQGAPFVVLAACHAAHPTYSVDEPLSLPAAFIEAGARGVLAATVKIPDLEAQDFFNAVRERMRAGTAPALALRDERMLWKKDPRWERDGRGKSWLDSVLLFE